MTWFDNWREKMSEGDIPRPPLGLEPRKIWVESRTRQVLEAMLRYLDAGMKIPREWSRELGVNLDDLEAEEK